MSEYEKKQEMDDAAEFFRKKSVRGRGKMGRCFLSVALRFCQTSKSVTV